MAFLQQRPFRLPLVICDGYRSWDPAPDHVWANRLMIFCADVLQYCFSDSDLPRIARHEELVDVSKRWQQYRPHSFVPIYRRQADRTENGVLPQSWYIADCHIVGIQNMTLAMILLTVFDPNLPRLGPEQRVAMCAVDSQVKSMVLEICGIAVSNRQSPPAFLAATIAVTMCGDRFTDPVEQQALLDVLIETQQNYAWPTGAMQMRLKRAWGWQS